MTLTLNKPLGLSTITATTIASLTLATSPAQASLIGDSVDCDIVPNGTFWNCNPTSAIVTDPGAEFSLTLATFGEFFSIDIGESSIAMIYSMTSGIDLTSGEFVTFSDLNWTDFPGEISGFSLDIFGDMGITESDISFTADSIGINFNNTSWDPGDSIVVNLETIHATPVPEPNTILGMLAIGCLSLRLKHQKN